MNKKQLIVAWGVGMKKTIKLCLISLLSISLIFCLNDIAQAKGGGGGGYRTSGSYKSSSFGSKGINVNRSAPKSKGTSYTPSKSSKNYTPSFATGVKRDSKGHIERSPKAKKEFMKQTGYPNGRTGYVVYDVVPLKRGGADTPSNMQWQTKEVAKAKDKIE